MTKNEIYIVDQYVKYFGKTADVATIAKYSAFTKASTILKEIKADADNAKTGLSTTEYVNSVFNNLFGRNATRKEMNKYSKLVEKGKDLPINSIVKKAASNDKAVYANKLAVATQAAEKGATTSIDLSKISDTNKVTVVSSDTATDLQTKIDALPVNNFVPSTEAGQTFMLTANADTTFAATEKADTFNSYDFVALDGSKHPTLTGIDALNGGAGKDILNVISDNNIEPVNATVSNIEVINLQSSGDVAFNTTTYTGVETLNTTKGDSATLTAAATTNVNVSGITGAIKINDGKNIVVTDATNNNSITVDGAAGTVTVTDTKQGTEDISANGAGDITVTSTGSVIGGDINVTDGANVTVTSTATASNGDIYVGGEDVNPTGNVVVTSNLNSDGSTLLNGGVIEVNGGKTVNVTVNATNADKDNHDYVNIGDITVNGDANTTTVTVKQTKAIDGVTETAAVAAATEVASVKFVALTQGQTVTLDGLTFTAAKALTAAEVAAAFANLKADATHGDAKADNGIYSGQLNSYNTGAVSTDTVVFTAATAGDIGDLVNNGTDLADVVTTTTQGVDAVTAVTAVGGISNGNVDIDGAKITTITLDGYADSDLGNNVELAALTTLNLANSIGTAHVNVTAAVTSLNLTVNNVQNAIHLDDAETSIKTLNLTTTGTDSAFYIEGDAVETLTIVAAAGLDISDSDTAFDNLKTVTVSGAGDVDLGNLSDEAHFATLTSTATGSITAKVAGTTTVTTGAGADSIEISNAVTKAITLGAGDDTLTLASGTTTLGANIDAGADTDTLVMTAADAAVATASSTFEGKIAGFEKLEIDTVQVNDGALVVDLDNMDEINYVITDGVTLDPDATYEVATVTFESLLSGQSVTVNGTTLTAAANMTATEVAEYFDITNSNGWTSSDNDGATVEFTSNTIGNVTDFTAPTVSNSAVTQISTINTTDGNSYAGTTESTTVTVGGLIAGESTSVVHNGGTMTLTATAITESAAVTFTGNVHQAEYFTIGGMTVTVGLGDATAAEIAQTFATGIAVGNLTVTGSIGVSGYTAALSGATVTFTSTVPGTNVTDLTVSSNAAHTSTTVTQGANGNLTAAQVAAALAAEATNGAAVISGTTLGSYTGTSSGSTVTYTAGSVGSLTNITATTTSGITPVVNVSTNGSASTLATETTAITFTALKSGQTVLITDWDAAETYYTAAADMTASEVATAIAALSVTGYTDSVSGAVVTYTSVNSNLNVDDLTAEVSAATAPTAPTAITQGGVNASTLEIKNLANNGTVEIAGNGTTTVTMKDASGSADTLNVVLTGVNATISATAVETIKVSLNDSDTENASSNNLNITDSALKTVTVTGADDLILTTNSAVLTSVDASVMTGALTYTASVANLVVKGGSGDDSLTASANAVTLNGNAGDDTLTATADSAILNGGAGNDILISNDYATLTGGTGSDTFVVSTIFDKDSFATITDFSKTDVDSIQFNGADDFINTAVVTNNMDFEAALNKAIETAGANDITWFTFTNNSQTNTYLVYDQGTDGTSFDFAQDMVIKVTGTVDFSAAGFNNSTDSVAFLNAITGNNIQ